MKNIVPENVKQIAEGFEKAGLSAFLGDMYWASGEDGICLNVGECIDTLHPGMSDEVAGLNHGSLMSFCFNLSGKLVDYDGEMRHFVVDEVNEKNKNLLEMYGDLKCL